MLQAIHDKSKGVFAMIIIGVIGVVFVFWGVEFVSVGGLTASRGVEVNGEDVNAETVRRAYQEELSQYQVAFGAAGVPEEVRQAIEQQVVNEAVRGELVRQRTAELRFLASDAEVLQSLQEIPAFQVDGRFSRDAYYAALRAANIEPDYFESQQRQLLAARQLDRGIFASAFVLPGEIERRVALRDESRDIGWVVLPAASFHGRPRAGRGRDRRPLRADPRPLPD
jgi:peptidyl-prolyl cis-trans isomerase D